MYRVQNIDTNEILNLTQEEYDAFCLAKGVTKNKMKKTTKAYNGNDPRHHTHRWKLLDNEPDIVKCSKCGGETGINNLIFNGQDWNCSDCSPILKDLKNICGDGSMFDGRNTISKNEGFDISKLKVKIDFSDLGKTIDELVDKVSSEKECYKALLFSDNHYPYQDKECEKAFMSFIKDNKFDEIVDFGDGIDAGAISTHLRLEDEQMGLYEEMDGYSKFTLKIKDIINAPMICLEDNHYHTRLKRYIAQNPAMKNMIKEVNFGYDKIVTHGVPYFPLQQYGQNLIAGIHGVPTNDNFTKTLTMEHNHDMMCGHLHTIQSYHNKNTKTAYGLPCMCKIDMAYLMGRKTRWRQGWSVLSWYPKQNRYVLEIIEYSNGKAIYRDKIYYAE